MADDLADQAIEFIRDAKVIDPDKPFFMYLAPQAGHAPHQAPVEWIDKYKGKFDEGYEAIRAGILAKQIELGLLPEGTELSEINPHGEPTRTGPDGQPWPLLDTVRPWDSLSADEQRLFARMAEVFAGYISYWDDRMGRVLDYLEESGQLDNTLIVVISDNGASGEGGPNGEFNEWRFFNGLPSDPAATLGAHRRARLAGVVQPLQHRVGVGVRHAVPVLEALGRRRGWRRRHVLRVVAGEDRRRRHAAPAVRPRGRRRPDGLRPARHHAARDDQGLTCRARSRARASRRRSPIRRCRASGRSSTRCSASARSTTTAGSPRRVHPPLSGWGNFEQDEWELFHLETDRSQSRERRGRPPRRVAGAEGPLVLLRGHLQRSPARRPHRARAGARRTAEGRTRPDALRVLPELRRRPRVRRRRDQRSLVHDRRRRRARLRRRRGRALRARRRRRRALALREGPEAQVRVQLGRHPSADDRGRPRDHRGSTRARRRVRRERSEHAIRTSPASRAPRRSTSTTRPSGPATIITQPGYFCLVGDGICVGRDSASPVTPDYADRGTFAFTGGTIDKVVVDVTGEHYVDHEAQVRAWLLKD